ncbi:phage major capsid protein [Clostridium tertium]|uniref:phage major capsid protein n=1 Tax=Clostridium tertium TaxID=1559 RepID=UPI00189DFEA1|nr:phage major capsid protein [Clostridium tertium]MDB1949198.1 phage major capsid protein [Clostridium tertium]
MKNKILKSIEGNINKSLVNAAILTSEGLSVKQKFFNEIMKDDFEEARLKDLVKNYDIKEMSGTFSVVASGDLGNLEFVEELGKIPVDSLRNIKAIKFKKSKLSGIISFNETQFSDDNTLSDFVIETLTYKLIKSENIEILRVLNNKESINIPSVKGEEGSNAFISIVNSNLKQDSIKNGSIFANYSFYKEVDTYDNRSKGILKKEEDKLYYMDKPLYVVGDDCLEDITPVAFVGNFKRAAGFIEDKEGNADISINTKTGFLTDDILARIKSFCDVKELLSESYIKIAVKE